MKSDMNPIIDSIVTKGETMEKEMAIFTESVKTLIKQAFENCGINGNVKIEWDFKDQKIHNLKLKKQEDSISVQSVPFIGRFVVFTSALDEMDFSQMLSVSDCIIKAKRQGIVPTITKIQ